MRTMTVDAGGMAVVIEERAFGRIVRISGGREWMTHLGRRVLQKDIFIHRHRRNVCAAVVTSNAILFVLSAEQTHRTTGIVRRMAGTAGIGSHGGIAAEQSFRRDFGR